MRRLALPASAIGLAGLAIVLVGACARSAPPPQTPPPDSAEPAVETVVSKIEPPAPRAESPAPRSQPQRPAPPKAPRPATSPVFRPAAPTLLRVGLATDLAVVRLPCCQDRLVAETSAGVLATTTAFRVEPGGKVLSPAVYQLQVAALKDEGQAHELAAELERLAGDPAEVVFDAGSDLYRVRVGRYGTRAGAEAARTRMAAAGVEGSWIVSAKARLDKSELRLIHGDSEQAVAGRWLRFRGDGTGIQMEGGRYRGSVLVYLNDRGSLNVINELSLEDYLRGVVPKEMGPEVFDNLEALKAQTVAARTYTLKNLGEFDAEGYDICATPRCQVYGGMSVEHPLSDQAVAETAGEVLVWGEELVDALYSSTCGGHTENVEVIFPRKSAAYLRGVACLEAGLEKLEGTTARGAAFPDGLMRRLLPAGSATGAEALNDRMVELAELAGLAVPDDHLGSLERREVQRFTASVFDLALDARLFVSPEDLAYLIDNPPPDWSPEDRQLAAYLLRSGLLVGRPDEPLGATEIEESLFRLALYLRVLTEIDGRYLGQENGQLKVRSAGVNRTLPLVDDLATFRRSGGSLEGAPLTLVAGDRIDVYLHGARMLAVTQEIDLDGVAFDRSSNMSSWTRFRSDDELGRLVQARYPGLDFQTFAIVSRGVSGRVGEIRLTGADGRTVDVEGLAVRWTLDLPDTLFTAKRLVPPEREPGWLFNGRGWGHGVGLCQIGAYGMGVRGYGYRDILEHYYTGVEISWVRPVERSGPDA